MDAVGNGRNRESFGFPGQPSGNAARNLTKHRVPGSTGTRHDWERGVVLDG
jgi:hypothetical protein